jgi:ABC-2 type transport system ATP-binding protein
MSLAAGPPAIETRDVAKRYGAFTALRDLTLTVGRGEIFGFLGRNGAGKTTAVKILLGLTTASAGRATLLGKPLGDVATRRRVGYLPELFRYQEWLTAREVLAFHAELLGLPQAGRAAAIAGSLAAVGLAERAGTRVGGFSKGMQQRLGLGVALLGDPDVLFLDEPTSALDPIGRADVRALVLAARARGATVFLNSHLLAEVETVCDRIAILDRGRVIAQGSMREILGNSAVRFGFATAPAGDARAVLEANGAAHLDERTFLLRGLSEADVPELIAALVRGGARLLAVEPVRGTLEERFLALVGEENDGVAIDRAPRRS